MPEADLWPLWVPTTRSIGRVQHSPSPDPGQCSAIRDGVGRSSRVGRQARHLRRCRHQHVTADGAFERSRSGAASTCSSRTRFPFSPPSETWDLLAIADAVAALPDGEDALRQTSAKSANFKSAKPGYAHRVLAHLMLEGAIDILTTNWDNCIERGSGEERLPTVTNDQTSQTSPRRGS